DWGSDLGDDPNRTSNSIASSHILALNYDHWHYSVVARYFHNGADAGPEAEYAPACRTACGWRDATPGRCDETLLPAAADPPRAQ
ncbi:hypothetical protein MJM04_32510, partial [Salmonella enterica subsp. enterica serovar Cerro]|nr:hypothetical protein [Salmonella enterica subsp. enterica serovar Cerro]